MSIYLSEHITLEELTTSQSATRYNISNTPSSEVISNLKLVCSNLLEPIRSYFSKPIIVSSGYRSPELNRKIGGAASSQHVTGNAIDFIVQGISVTDTVKYIYTSGLNYDQLIHEGTWTHVSYTACMNRKQTLQAVFDHNGHATYKEYNIG